MKVKAIGALVGWRRVPLGGGTAIRLQLAESARDQGEKNFQLVVVSLNDRRLASLIRDLLRAAEARGISQQALKNRY